MARLLIVGLHGFLGRGADWDPWKADFQDEIEQGEVEFWCPDLLSPHSELHPGYDFAIWAERFIKQLQGFVADKYLLAGYSMGGRLALHALMQEPEMFSGAILLSTCPFLLDASERQRRQDYDLHWAHRFLHEPWDKLMMAWNSQPVFIGEQKHPDRKESYYSRKFLAQALENWSLSRHLVTLKSLQDVRQPCLWVAGEKDAKFVGIIEELKRQHVPSHYLVVKDANHRLVPKVPSSFCLSICVGGNKY